MQVIDAAGGDLATISAARGVVERQLKHLTRLIDDLLDVSLGSQGKLALRREFIELDTLIGEALDMVQPSLEARQQIVRVELGTMPLVLHADRDRLAHAFAKVLDNAAKYSPLSSLILVSAHLAGDDVVVSVTDPGAGIPPDRLEQVFELFRQVRPAGSEGPSGLGIGLTLVKQVIDLHGGSVRAHSMGHGRGTQIIMRLPRAQSLQPAAKAAEATPEMTKPSPMRILIADDNRDAAQALAMMLRLEGHEVRTVHEGAEAIKAGATVKPQVVLLDIDMPGLDGYATARQIAREPWGADAYLVALTGWGDDAARRKAVDAGFQEHLVKPAEPEAIMEVIERASRR